MLGEGGIREIDFATLSYTPGNFYGVSPDIKKSLCICFYGMHILNSNHD